MQFAAQYAHHMHFHLNWHTIFAHIYGLYRLNENLIRWAWMKFPNTFIGLSSPENSIMFNMIQY